jgi:aspartate/tyrosine/aromatic aminotransferase
MLVADPSRSEYEFIAREAGIKQAQMYPYWDFENRKLAFEPMLNALNQAESE